MALPTSIISTTFNAENTLQATLQSIVAQTDPHWQLIIVDDGSTDATPRILESYALSDTRIQPTLSAKIGRGKALNLALASVTSDYFLNIDADDMAHPDRLKWSLGLMRRSPGFTAISGNALLLGEGEQPNWPTVPSTAATDALVTEIGDNLLTGNPICHSAVICRTKDVLMAGGYDETRKSQIDYELWMRLQSKGLKLGVAELCWTAKRLHPDQKFQSHMGSAYAKASLALQWQFLTLKRKRLRYAPQFIARYLWFSLGEQLRGRLRKLKSVRQLPITRQKKSPD